MAVLRDHIDATLKWKLPDADSVISNYLPEFNDETKRTDAEVAAGVTPVNYAYVPGDIRRYGAVGDGTSLCTQAIQDAIDSGHEVIIPLPAVSYLIDDNLILPTLRPISIRGEGFGWTSGGPVDGGTWIELSDSAPDTIAVFDAPAKIVGVTMRDFGIKLNNPTGGNICIQFAEILQGSFKNIRIEGANDETDVNLGFRFLDPVATIGGTYSGGVTIEGCVFSAINSAIELQANCTTFRICHNDFHGNLATDANAINLAADTVGVRIGPGNHIEGWDIGVNDNGNANLIFDNYFENNDTTADMGDATTPMFISNSIITGGSPVFPSDRTKAAIWIGPRHAMFDDAPVEAGLGIIERYRAFKMGEYPTFTPTFTANNSMTFTSVTTGTVQGSTTLLRYNVYGKEVEIDFKVDGTVGGTPSTELRFSLPSGYDSPTGRVIVPCVIFNNGATAIGQIEIRNGEAFARVLVVPGASWTAGTAGFYGQISYFANI
jgi:hypothetical protein